MKRKKNILRKSDTKKKLQKESTFYRLIFLGDNEVGKTQLINKYNNTLYQEEYLPTYCVEFQVKPIKINGKKVNIHCIDTQGSLDFTPNTGTLFIKKTDAFIFVFDLTSRESLYNLQDYINIIKTALTDSQKIINEKIIYFVGNKCDLIYRQVEENEAKLEANKYTAKYMEVSAKTGINIDRLFNSIIQDITTKKDEISVNSNSVDSGGGGSINKNMNINNDNNNNINNININQNLNNKNEYTNVVNINNNINNNIITNNYQNVFFDNTRNNNINTNINNNIKTTIKNKNNINNNINTNNDNNTNIDNITNTNTNLIENEKSGLNYDNSSYFLKSNYSVNNINNNNNDLVKNINNIGIDNKGMPTNGKIYPNIKNNENYLKKCYIF